jgi:peroxiredoxin
MKKPSFMLLILLSLLVNCGSPPDKPVRHKDAGGTASRSASGDVKKAPDAVIPAGGSAAEAAKNAPAGVSNEIVPKPVPAPGPSYIVSARAPYSAVTTHAHAPEAAETAPDFVLSDLNGGTFRLSDMKGRVVVLNFFATWCRYCVSELPELDSAESALRKERMDLFLISSEPKEVLEEFMRKNGYSFQVLLDEGGRVSALYGVSSIPRTFLIGKKGDILYSKRGEIRSVDQDLIMQLHDRQPRKRY